MKKIVTITPPDAAYGFALAGVRQLVRTPQELDATLPALMADPATGVIIIDERLVSGPAQRRIEDIERRWPGLVVVLPAPGKPQRPEEDYVLRLIRRTIGYQVRLTP
ncbi:MAG TPA: V-type ATP synthase subunit F [Bryobacteraceae bacterium]|nr:V-type ATP synthase subunit F [Bryobacteraceae bacterium]